ncbi:MAG: flavin reductase family protein [Bacteroidota bacterium]|nr:flavin reductase family protein [Bacteroidota bacterium]
MKSIVPQEEDLPTVHKNLISIIGPRPICFASTIDKKGNSNLAPYSFFNLFSAKPPILVFSPARSGRTNLTKDTHENLKEVPEVVVNVVSYNMVWKMSIASSPYPRGTNEFKKAGFTEIPSDLVRPSRLKESPAQLECKVLEIKELGTSGGAGNLVICEILKIHINEEMIGESGYADPRKMDLVARMGDAWYCRANGEALFKVEKSLAEESIGFDRLPRHIQQSTVLSANDLGKLAALEKSKLPDGIDHQPNNYLELHKKAKALIDSGKTEDALQILIAT